MTKHPTKQVKIAQIDTFAVPDQIGKPTLVILGLDVEGRIWRREFDWSPGVWERVENPPASTRDYSTSIVRGR